MQHAHHLFILTERGLGFGAQLSLEKKDEKKKKKKKARMGSALSFADEDEEGAEQETVKMPKLGKNPNVDTNFLPDKDREEASRLKREELAREWEQAAMLPCF